jgi:hypothetical protein
MLKTKTLNEDVGYKQEEEGWIVVDPPSLFISTTTYPFKLLF